MNVNVVVLAGRLTRDPEVRHTPIGTAVAELGLAVNRIWSDRQTGEKKEDTTFVDITVFGKQVEAVGAYLRKGSTVLIEGRLQLDAWEDKQTGQKRTKLKVVADSVQFGDRPGAGLASEPKDAAPPAAEGAPF